MNVEIVTKEDLQILRQQLLNDLKILLAVQTKENVEWLRSIEVRKMLKISPGTLQNLRITGKLNPVKIGGIFFYKSIDVDNLLNKKEQC